MEHKLSDSWGGRLPLRLLFPAWLMVSYSWGSLFPPTLDSHDTKYAYHHRCLEDGSREHEITFLEKETPLEGGNALEGRNVPRGAKRT